MLMQYLSPYPYLAKDPMIHYCRINFRTNISNSMKCGRVRIIIAKYVENCITKSNIMVNRKISLNGGACTFLKEFKNFPNNFI